MLNLRGGCFPESCFISIENGKSISISKVQKGDVVLTFDFNK